jgi:dipeptidyl aminopeptidase/acylaminoacyl peptidase
MSRRFVFTLLTLIIILIAAALSVYLAKGYTFSTKEGKFVGTGIIAVTSLPDGASIYLDGHLTGATNTNISSLPPKEYDVKVIKEGFIPWEKKVHVNEGLVTDLKITLFPAIPTLYPLTFNGVENPMLSPDGQRLAFTVPQSTPSATLKQKGGVWVWTMIAQPIAFARSAQPQQLIPSTSNLDFSKSKMRFSPDSKQLLVTVQEGGKEGTSFERNYLLNTDQTIGIDSLSDITPSVATVLRNWDEEQKTKDEARRLTLTDSRYQDIASSSAKVIWSPDETKMLVSKDGQKDFKVYDFGDVKTQRSILVKEYSLPTAKIYQWLPDSRHIIMVYDGQIAVADYDGSNPAIVYAGNFQSTSVFPWPDSSRLVFITSFPTPTASQPNLYGINLK